MKKRIIYILIAFSLASCEKFLEKTPSEGGIESFTDVSQFDALLNDIRVTRNRYEWNHAILASDDLHFHPDFQTANPSGYQQREAFNIWNENELKNLTGSTNGFIGTFAYMYTFNYITDRIEGSNIGGSDLLKKQVKAEAMFFRALYYFQMTVQYCMHPGLNNGENPGLGYKNTISTEPDTYNDRKTVKYTLDKIVEDLQQSETMLLEVGKTDFNIRQPWRPSAVTVQALRARVELYLGNYPAAFQYAKKAYDAYQFLYDMNNAALFTMINRGTLQTETLNGVTYSVYAQSPGILTNAGNTTDPESNSFYYYKEAYFRFTSQIAAANKLPPSQDLYNLYDTSDLRKKIWYDNNMNINSSNLFKASRKDQLVSKSYMKHATGQTGSGYLLGVTVPEIMMILAECRARGAGDGENASVIMKTLRKTRFKPTYVDNIGGTLKDVKDERRRELAFTMRWYDLKRYNALDNENIVIRKLGRRDVYQLSSDLVTWVLQPNSPAYALPIPQVEISLLGWNQNVYGGVSIQ